MQTQVKSLTFSGLPRQSKLFIEYLTDPLGLREFYPNAVVNPADVSEFAGEVLLSYETNRERLCDALVEINRRAGAGAKAFDHITLLREADTVAVVTGQQAGLFTGPMYTIYKALSAVKLAEELSARGTRAVPVFWAATEDHDFDEVAEAYFLSKNGGLGRCGYAAAGLDTGISVGAIKIDAAISGAIDDLCSHLPDTQFSAKVRELLETSYSAGNSFGAAFEMTLAKLFHNYGLIILDPLHEQLKQLAAPVYGKIAKCSDEIVSAIRLRNQRLESDGFHAQVLVEDDYFPLFWHDDDGRRLALRKAGEGTYRVKGGKQEFSGSEIQQAVLNEPARFSPGVMVRSLVQDCLLPTVCYFGGAAEIAYFAQNSEAYRVLERPVTPVFHRQSFTIIESRHRRTLDRFGWDLTSLFVGQETAYLEAAEKVLSPETAKLFADVEEKINTELNRLDQQLSATDPTLAANLATRRRKIIYHIATLRKKALMSETRKDESIRRQIDSLFSATLPKGDLQERSINIFNYLNAYGFGFIDLLYNSIDLDDKDHRLIYL